MVRILIFLFAFSLFSCTESPLQKELSSAVAMRVKFLTAGGDVEKTVETDNADAMANMARFVDSKVENDRKCSFDGYMEFIYLIDKIQTSRTVQFSLDSKCKQFITESNGKIVAYQMSDEGADFFNALRKGQPV